MALRLFRTRRDGGLFFCRRFLGAAVVGWMVPVPWGQNVKVLVGGPAWALKMGGVPGRRRGRDVSLCGGDIWRVTGGCDECCCVRVALCVLRLGAV